MTPLVFIIIVLLSLLLFYFGTGKNKRHLIYFLSWQCIVGTLAFFKVFQNHPTFFPVIILGTVILTYFLLRNIDQQKIHYGMLLIVHTLRIPVELILLQLYFQHKIPVIMTFGGWNFDILIGFSAVVISLYQLVFNRKINDKILVFWNIIGIVFLSIIVTLAILSSPLPVQQFAFDQPNIALLEFPYSFLPSCVVPIVFMSHILCLIKLKNNGSLY